MPRLGPRLDDLIRKKPTADKTTPARSDHLDSVPRLEPTNRRVIDVVGKRNLAQRLTGYHTLQGFARLMLDCRSDRLCALKPDCFQCGSAGPNGQRFARNSELRAILQLHEGAPASRRPRQRPPAARLGRHAGAAWLKDDGRIFAEAHEKLVGIGLLGGGSVGRFPCDSPCRARVLG
jgi:hypothetical protein